MSIIDRPCGEQTSGLICAHINQFYKNVGGDPAVFYYLEAAELPPGYEIIPTLSDSDDECHREVINVSNNALKKKFKGLPIDRFFICDQGGPRPLTEQDIIVFRQMYPPS